MLALVTKLDGARAPRESSVATGRKKKGYADCHGCDLVS